MTQEQFSEIIEIAQEHNSVVVASRGIGIHPDSLTELFKKLLTAMFNYADPEQKGLHVVMFFVLNSYYPVPDGAATLQIRDVATLYNFWLLCIEHGNPTTKTVTASVSNYKQDLE